MALKKSRAEMEGLGYRLVEASGSRETWRAPTGGVFHANKAELDALDAQKTSAPSETTPQPAATSAQSAHL